MCQEHNGTRIYTKADRGNSGYWSEELCSEEQALRGASRGALRARSEGPRSLPGSRCNATLQQVPTCSHYASPRRYNQYTPFFMSQCQNPTRQVPRSLLCPHIPGRFQVESMPIPCGFHGFHMEFVWLRAQPFWRKFPCSFHMETPWNLNIPWNIPLESRWNGMESTTIPSMESIWIPHIPHRFHSIPQYSIWIPHISHGFHIFHMDSIVFHMDSTQIPQYSIWIPHIPYGFHSIPHGFHIFHMDSTYFIWIPWYSIQIPHGFISNI